MAFEILEIHTLWISVIFPSVSKLPTITKTETKGSITITTVTTGIITSITTTTGTNVQTTIKSVKPTDYILDLIEQAKAEERTQMFEIKKTIGITGRPIKNELLKASSMVYADTDGTNLRDILGRDDVDPTRTISNDVHEIKSVLGIEAARNFLISEINSVIAHEGTYINPRHIILLVDFMTSLGDVYGVTFSGVSRQPIGPLAKASFERAMDTFKEASLFGTMETIQERQHQFI